ncbi:G1/S-specific cyclin-E2-like [Aplochiton taeniatus]
MLAKDKKYTHSKSFIELHPRIQPRMRSILLDWLLEVSEVYTLHRQTFYLAQDYFDRFMKTQKDIDKDRLQLIGITALFIAAKMEEIYPPKLSELAYVTDGACLETQILQMELVILTALDWELCPETAVSWLKLYIQMASLQIDSDVLHPQVPQEVYVQVTRLLDLCILNINSLDFEYRVLAAAVLCHFIPFETVEKVSGLPWDDLDACVDWMSDFVVTVVDWGKVELKNFARVSSDDRHNIQTHTDYIDMLDQAQRRGEYENQFMTPPSSTEKLPAC